MERSDPFQELFPCCDEYDLPFFSGSNDNGEENTGNQASVSSVTLVAESEVPLRDTLSGEALTPNAQQRQLHPALEHPRGKLHKQIHFGVMSL